MSTTHPHGWYQSRWLSPADPALKTCGDLPLVDALMTVFSPGQSVNDFGCEVGCYVNRLRERGIDCVGWDGTPGAGDYANCDVADVSQPVDLRRADWVLSLEVGEHIPASAEQVFLENIARHCRLGAVVSWAIPGQGGRGHVNERPNDYIREKLHALGLVTTVKDRAAETRLRAAASLWWFRHTIMVFSKLA